MTGDGAPQAEGSAFRADTVNARMRKEPQIKGNSRPGEARHRESRSETTRQATGSGRMGLCHPGNSDRHDRVIIKT